MILKKRFLLVFCIFLLVLFLGCVSKDGSKHLDKTSMFRVDDDCSQYCKKVSNCSNAFFILESRCIEGKCICKCKLGEKIRYNGIEYVRTNEIERCRGYGRNFGNLTIWDNSDEGVIYTPYHIDLSRNEFKCYKWVEKQGFIIKGESKYIRGDDIKFLIKNLENKDKILSRRESYLAFLEPDGKLKKLQLPIERDLKLDSNGNLTLKLSSEFSKNLKPGKYRLIVTIENKSKSFEFEMEPGVEIKINTDKENYSSFETVNITLKISSHSDFKKVRLLVHGLSHGNGSLNYERELELKKGTTNITIQYRLPFISQASCAPMHPGHAYINVELQYENITIAKNRKSIVVE